MSLSCLYINNIAFQLIVTPLTHLYLEACVCGLILNVPVVQEDPADQ